MGKFRFFFLLTGIFVLLVGVGGATAVPVADGDLDPTFNSDGIVTTSFGSTEETGYAMAIDDSNRVVMVGSSFKIARLNSSGYLEPGPNEFRDWLDAVNLGEDSGGASDTAVQSDGKVIMAGTLNNDDFVIYRYHESGSRDLSFGNGGRAVLDFGGFELLNAIILQSDDKIVAVGFTDSQGDGDFAVARFTADGQLDTTFGGGDGKAVVDFGGGELAFDVAVREDDKFAVAGTTVPLSGGQHDIAVARFTANGSLDTSFSGDGKVITDLGGTEYTRGVTWLAGTHQVVVTGYNNSGSDAYMVRYNSNGSLDSGFDGDGVVDMDWGFIDHSFAVLEQPDGQFVVAGYGWQSGQGNFIVARYAVNGVPDMSFGDGTGKQVISVGTAVASSDRAFDVVLQSDHKIVVGGVSDPNGDEDFALVRLNSDGSIDTTYHLDGRRTVDFGESAKGMAVALQPDGQIVAVGSGKGFTLPEIGVSSTPHSYPLVSRYSPSGHLDSSFDSDGLVIDDTGTYITIEDVHVRANGKILAVGHQYSIPFFITLIQYNADGTLDTDFGANGHVNEAFALEEAAYDSFLMANGQLVATGYVKDEFSSPDLAVFRFNEDGSPDMAFGTDGVARVDLGGWEYGRSVAVQPDGKIVIAGYTDANFEFDMALLRFNSNGSLDTSFDGDGIVYGDFVGDQDYAFGVAILDNGKIIVGGYSDLDFAVVRYNSNGSLDTTFGTNGRTTTHIAGSDYVNDMLVQNDGRIVLIGSTVPANGNRDFAIARYNPNGTLDTTFSGDGINTTDLGGQDNAQQVVQQPDGKLVAVGYTDIWGNNDFALVRYEGTPCTDCDYVLTVNSAGTGSGTVTSTPAGINCGTDCTETYSHGSEVVLTAVADSDSIFSGWGGACAGSGSCTVSMTDAQTVFAHFDLIPEGSHALTVSLDGEGSGSVSSSMAGYSRQAGGGGINCDPTPNAVCTAIYPEGTEVTLQAVADAGSVFMGWSGAGCTGTGECVVMMTAETAVTATFAEGYIIHLPIILNP